MRRKKILIALSSFLAFLLLFALLAPTLLSGYARDVVEREIGARVNGSVALKGIHLAWFSPQRVEGLAVDGGAGVGKVDVSLEVAQGLLALASGSDVTLKIGGSAETAFDAEGRIGLAQLAKPAEGAETSSTDKPATAASSASDSSSASPLGTRKLRVELADIDFTATGPDGAVYALNDIGGEITLAGSVATIAIDAATRAAGRDGELSIDADATLAFSDTGGLDVAKTTGKALIGASKLSWPTAAGELSCSTLRIDASKSAQGDIALKADIVARVAGSSEATVKVDVAIGAPFDGEGKFILDPAAVSATIEARGIPMAALQPFAPEIAAGTRIDFAKDIGDTADLTVVKQKGDRARIGLASKQIQFTFDGAVAADGSSVEGGSVEARASVRPELLQALGLLDATTLEIALRGEQLVWKKGDDALRSFSGAYEVELAKALEFRSGSDPLRVRAESMKLSIVKDMGSAIAHAVIAAKATYGVAGNTELSASGDIDLASRALTTGALDLSARLDPAFVERISSGAVAVRAKEAVVKLMVPEFAYIPSEDFSGIRAVLGRARVELSGALAVEGAGATAAVNDLSIDVVMPRGGKPGTMALGAKVDGAGVRVDQRFGPFPADAFAAGGLNLSALGLNGSIAIKGLDPSFIARVAPAAAKYIGMLGSGPMELNLRNRTERGAVLADFNLDANAIDASGALSYGSDAMSATNLAIDATLSAEALASLDLGDKTELEPGAKISLRVPMLSLARKSDAAVVQTWVPAGDLALRAVVEGLRVRRAPGIVAPLGIAKLDATASYAFAEERATVNGKATLGGGGSAGDLDFAVSWKKPLEAKLFGGTEGTLALTNFDLARFEPSFGLEAGAYSGVLGGAGSLRIAFAERGEPSGTITLDFPRTHGKIDLTVAQIEAAQPAGVRLAKLSGVLSAEIAAETFAKLAGLAKDPTRRVTAPVSIALNIASAAVALDAAMKPQIAGGAIDATGSLSAVSIDSVDAAGKHNTLSTGALALSIKSVRLADEIVLRINSKDASAAAGSLEVDAHIRGALAQTAENKAIQPANPTIDATIRATKFPAATIDALAGTGGAVGRYLGDAIDAQVDARGLSATAGALAVKLSCAFATLDAPALSIANGALLSGQDKPMTATFALSPAVREQLLASINPVFADITTGAPAKFALSSLSWPLDGDKSKFDAAFNLETGEVKLVNSGVVTNLLTLASAGRTDGFEAYLDPLRATVVKGRMTYRDFALRAGKTAQGGWRNSLVFSGDIDLAAKPMRANSIVTAIPLSDAANWSKDARGLFDALNAASPELVKSLAVGIEMSGPLFDPSGKPVKLTTKVKLPDVGDTLKNNPGAIIEAAGSIFDALRKKK